MRFKWRRTIKPTSVRRRDSQAEWVSEQATLFENTVQERTQGPTSSADREGAVAAAARADLPQVQRMAEQLAGLRVQRLGQLEGGPVDHQPLVSCAARR